MNWPTFYRDFAAAYGTCWLVLLALALVTQSHIDTGLFGFIGFPVIGLVYAVWRKADEPTTETQDELQRLQDRIARLERERNAP